MPTCPKYFKGPDLWSFWKVQNAPKYWPPLSKLSVSKNVRFTNARLVPLRFYPFRSAQKGYGGGQYSHWGLLFQGLDPPRPPNGWVLASPEKDRNTNLGFRFGCYCLSSWWISNQSALWHIYNQFTSYFSPIPNPCATCLFLFSLSKRWINHVYHHW